MGHCEQILQEGVLDQGYVESLGNFLEDIPTNE